LCSLGDCFSLAFSRLSLVIVCARFWLCDCYRERTVHFLCFHNDFFLVLGWRYCGGGSLWTARRGFQMAVRDSRKTCKHALTIFRSRRRFEEVDVAGFGALRPRSQERLQTSRPSVLITRVVALRHPIANRLTTA
jgi:hypothetical protein